MESGSPWESEALSTLRLQPTAQGAAAEPARSASTPRCGRDCKSLT